MALFWFLESPSLLNCLNDTFYLFFYFFFRKSNNIGFSPEFSIIADSHRLQQEWGLAVSLILRKWKSPFSHMIVPLEHQAASVQGSHVCTSAPSGKNEWAPLRSILWQVTCQSHDTEITCGQCQFFTLPLQIHVLLGMWVMHIDTWHMAAKLLPLQGRKGENIYVSHGGGNQNCCDKVD